MHAQLNGFLADLAVESHKIQAFHWYVKGPDFHQAHAQLETYYEEVSTMVDEVAELMLMRGMKPDATMARFLENSRIDEAAPEFITSKAAFAEIENDFQKLLGCARDLKAQAEKDDDDLVGIKADASIEYFSKAVWMLTQH